MNEKKCKGCQWYNKPYWSIINPCDNCPREKTNIETITKSQDYKTEEVKIKISQPMFEVGELGLVEDYIDYEEIRYQLHQKEKTIKEAREFIYENAYDSERQNCIDDLWGEIPKLLEILDKGSDKE